MLTGERPYHPEQGVREFLAAVEREELPRPSSLRPGLGREVDAIVLQALARRREDRYQSVDALVSDVRLYLAGEPIRAHPPSGWDQARKLLRRNPAASVLAAVLFAVALGSGAVALRQSARIAEERDQALAERTRAIEEARKAAAILRFLMDDVFLSPHPDRMGWDVTVIEMLEAAAGLVGERFAASPAVEAHMRRTLAQIFQSMGRLADAEKQLERSLALRRAEVRADPSVTARWIELAVDATRMGSVQIERRRFDEARALLEEADGILAGSGDAQPLALGELLNTRAILEMRVGRPDLAVGLFRESLELARRTVGEDHVDTLRGRLNVGVALAQQGEWEAAEESLEATYEVIDGRFGPDHPWAAMIQQNLAKLDLARGDVDLAELRLRQAVDSMLAWDREPNHSTARAVQELGDLLRQRGELGEAAEWIARSLELFEAVLGPDSVEVAETRGILGSIRSRVGELESAGPLLRGGVEQLTALVGARHPKTLMARKDLGLHLYRCGRLAEATDEIRRVVEAEAEAESLGGGPRPSYHGQTMCTLACLLIELGELEEGRGFASRGLAILRSADPPATFELGMMLGALEGTELEFGSEELAEDYRRELDELTAR